MRSRTKRVIALSAIAILVLTAGAACSSVSDGDGAPATRFEDQSKGEGAPPAGDAFANGSGEDSDVTGFEPGDSTVPAGDTGAAPDLQSSLDRKIVQNSSIDLEMEDVGRQFQEVIRLADANGGFVVNSTFSNAGEDEDGNPRQIGDITIRVPADRYQEVLNDIRALGTVKQEQSDASDVTEEYTDLQSRLRQLRATERRYLELLADAQNINEILTVQDRLDSVIAQIEQIQGRINLLDNLTDMATITAHLRPLAIGTQPSAGGGGLDPLEAAENAWDASLETLRGLAVVALAVVAYSWWLLPPAGAIALGVRWYAARRPRPPTSASA